MPIPILTPVVKPLVLETTFSGELVGAGLDVELVISGGSLTDVGRACPPMIEVVEVPVLLVLGANTNPLIWTPDTLEPGAVMVVVPGTQELETYVMKLTVWPLDKGELHSPTFETGTRLLKV